MGGTKLECYAILGGEKQQQEAVNDYWGCTRQQQGIISFHKFQDFSSSLHKQEEAGVNMDNKQPPISSTSSSNSSIEESIRKTMQMHEHIFQHQVRELHRLYNTQKTMMKEESMKMKKQTGILLWNQYSTSNWPPPPPPPPPPKQIEEDEVELTLSIGVSSDPNKPKKKRLCTSHPKSFNSSLSIESDKGGGGGDVLDNSGSTTETSDNDKKRPFWLFQL